MGEEASDADYDRIDAVAGEDDEGEFEDGRVLEWEIGLPSGDELTPLSQTLVPPALASAFRINPEPPKSPLDVQRASQHTISNLRRVGPSAAAAAALRSFHPYPSHPAGDADDDEDETMVVEDEELVVSKCADGVESSSRKVRRMDSASHSSVAAAATEEAESSAAMPGISNDDQSAKMLKRTRLVWTPQLHKRFVDVVAHLGIKNAVPKTIMQLMNVEGLTRENVASHLQKYRLYLKRMHGLSNEGPSPSDQLFASTPVPQSLHELQVPPPAPIPVPMPYVVPTMYPMPMFGVAHPHGPGNQMGVVPATNHQVSGACHGFEPHHPYGAFGDMPKDWSGGKQFGSIVSYPRATPSDK